MVVVSVEPTCWFMERAGIATGTRNIATRLWQGRLPDRPPAELVQELYEAENRGRNEPSGSQDMIGLIYPGISRLDYDFQHAGGVFPCHIESNNDPHVAQWLEQVLHILPVAPRPEGYNPLGVKNLDPQWIQRLGKTGQNCYDAILRRDAGRWATAMNECMACWEAILPHTVRHPAVTVDLLGLLPPLPEPIRGAMYSGCGGGYLFVVSEQPVPGALHATVRTS